MNLDKLLPLVEKPARYTGGELNMVKKANAEVNFVFSYPDTYEVGMSHLGGKIIYHLLNEREDTFCRRAYAPWPDMEEKMRDNGIPLFDLETHEPVKNADIWGFTLQYELSFTNIINMLDLAGVEKETVKRSDDCPLIVAGGPCGEHSEMLAPYIDAIMLGDGEDILGELINEYKLWKKSGENRHSLLLRLSHIDGFYVPSLYRHETVDGKLVITPLEGAPNQAHRRVVEDFEHAFIPVRPIVPFIEVVHDRIMLEIFRGCTRGCRFCQAGFLYRPVRERSVETLVKAARETAKNTGYDEISLTSLSSGDYTCLNGLVNDMNAAFKKEKMDISLPSLRIDSFDPRFVSTQMRKSSLTFAPEAGSQRLRNVINKNVCEEDLLRTVRSAFEAGFSAIKLYFMIGLPSETMEDIAGIADLALKCVNVYRELHNGSERQLRITVSTSVFIPKPFTPFQWCAHDNEQVVKEKQQYLASLLRKMRAVEYRYHDSGTSKLEAACARGGRELAPVLLSAWQKGAKMDAWSEYFKPSAWREAFEENGLSLEECASKTFDINETLPWDSVDAGVTKAYLARELERAKNEQTTPDCRNGCTGCGMNAVCGRSVK